jgi:FMN phosphatase YigB (HAD superfamily)
VRSYKPDPAHFKECARRIGTKKGWVHIAASYYHDVEPCLKEKVPVIWVNRNREELDPGPEEADGRGQEPPRSGQAARRRVGGSDPPPCASSP